MADYPLGVRGKIIGTPYVGTHTLGNWQSDNALDIAVPEGTPVYAVADGTIGSRIGAFNTKNPRFAGLRVTLEGQGNSYYYAHMSKLNVKAGEQVRAGQIIGWSGEANGVAHLHFAVQKGNPGDVIRGASVPTGGWAAPAATEQPAPAASGLPDLAVTPPVAAAPPVSPPGVGAPAPALPGSTNYTLDEGGDFATWQSISQMPDLSPDTQRLLALSGVTNGT